MNRDVLQENIRIASAHGRLAGQLAYSWDEPTTACLVVNPHPYMGGHMENNVVATLAMEMARVGMVSLRFDYAGVGQSTGPAVDLVAGMAEFWATGKSPYDAAMQEDVVCAAQWMRSNVSLPIVLIGYSFGAQALQCALADDVVAVVTVSPTLAHHDLSQIARLTVPKLVIYSDNDFATPMEQTQRWCATLSAPSQTQCIRGANHFFKGCEQELTRACRDFLGRRFAITEDNACPS